MSQRKTCKHCCGKELLNLKIRHNNEFSVYGVNTATSYTGPSLQILPLGSGDMLDFTLCVSCGQVAGNWRMSVSKIINDSIKSDVDYEFVN